jgi:hypothetical protein
MSKPRPLKTDFRGHDRWLVTAFAAGPLAALTNLTLSYFLTPESCQQGTKLWLHVSFAAFTVIAIASAAIARRIHARFAGVRTPDPLIERTLWQSTAALILSLASVLLLIAMEIPNVILRSCD